MVTWNNEYVTGGPTSRQSDTIENPNENIPLDMRVATLEKIQRDQAEFNKGVNDRINRLEGDSPDYDALKKKLLILLDEFGNDIFKLREELRNV